MTPEAIRALALRVRDDQDRMGYADARALAEWALKALPVVEAATLGAEKIDQWISEDARGRATDDLGRSAYAAIRAYRVKEGA